MNPRSLRLRETVLFAGIAAAALAADQLTKTMARASLPLGELQHQVGPFVFRRAENPGIALGALPAGDLVPPLIALLIVGLLLAFVAWGRIHPAFTPGCAFAVAGCFGNLLDRVLHGSVTDFLVVKPLPVFNVADIFILTGFLLMIGASLIADLAEPATQAHVQAPPRVCPDAVSSAV